MSTATPEEPQTVQGSSVPTISGIYFKYLGGTGVMISVGVMVGVLVIMGVLVTVGVFVGVLVGVFVCWSL